MRRTLLFLLAALLPLNLLCACTQAETKREAYPVYFAAEGVKAPAALTAESRTLETGENPVDGLLRILMEGPEGETLHRTIPSNVTLLGWTLTEGTLTADFSGRYGSLSGIDLTLADYSVVLTLCQLPEVDAVEITVDGEEVSYRDHQLMTAQEAPQDVFQQDRGEDASP